MLLKIRLPACERILLQMGLNLYFIFFRWQTAGASFFLYARYTHEIRHSGQNILHSGFCYLSLCHNLSSVIGRIRFTPFQRRHARYAFKLLFQALYCITNLISYCFYWLICIYQQLLCSFNTNAHLVFVNRSLINEYKALA
jgi:hypothetical protein